MMISCLIAKSRLTLIKGGLTMTNTDQLRNSKDFAQTMAISQVNFQERGISPSKYAGILLDELDDIFCDLI